MNIHKNARMTVHGRALLLSRILNERWRVADAAEAAGVSQRTAYKWLARYRAGGAAAGGSACRRGQAAGTGRRGLGSRAWAHFGHGVRCADRRRRPRA